MKDFYRFNRLIEDVSITSNRKSLLNRSSSGLAVVAGGLGQFYTLEVTIPKIKQEDALELNAFLDGLNGSATPFKFNPKVKQFNRYTGSIIVKDNSELGSNIPVRGLPLSKRVLKAGTYVRFENGDKVYQVIEDLVSNSIGEGVLELNSVPLGRVPDIGEPVLFQDVEFTVILNPDFKPRIFANALSFSQTQTIQLEEKWSIG